MSETLRNRSAVDITRWLCGIPDVPTLGLSSALATDFPSIAHQKRKPLWDLEIPQHERGRPAKRLRRTPIQAPSPPESLMDPLMNTDSHETHELGTVSHDAFPATPLPKKRRLDPNATPRAPVLSSDSASQAASLASTPSASSASTYSTASRTSSPVKQMANLEISNPFGIHFGTFDTGSLPTTLLAMRQQLHMFTSINKSIIPTRERALASNLATNSLVPLTDLSYYEDQEPLRYGPLPTVQQVLGIQANSQRCDHAAEVVWNTEVHHQVLRVALRHNVDRMESGMVNFSSCTSATIHKHLFDRGQRVYSKMVDFCLYLDSDVIGRTDPAALAAIQALRSRSKSKAVNHTDYHILRNHPIAFSIESKTQDGSMAAAALQVGTWQAAHWKFLQKLLAARGLDVGTLDFLPGLIVQGPEWYFVATTNVDGAKTLWTKQFIGSTMTAIGTYQVIRAIQTLAAWCVNEYWAWFRVYVLELDKETG